MIYKPILLRGLAGPNATLRERFNLFERHPPSVRHQLSKAIVAVLDGVLHPSHFFRRPTLATVHFCWAPHFLCVAADASALQKLIDGKSSGVNTDASCDGRGCGKNLRLMCRDIISTARSSVRERKDDGQATALYERNGAVDFVARKDASARAVHPNDHTTHRTIFARTEERRGGRGGRTRATQQR